MPHRLSEVSQPLDKIESVFSPIGDFMFPEEMGSIEPIDQFVNSKLIYNVRGSLGTPWVKVFDSCVNGTCSCSHEINGRKTQLLPCRFAPFLTGDSNLLKDDSEFAQFIWEGVVNGFKIVDEGCTTQYECKNYKSILEEQFYDEMCVLVEKETTGGQVTIVDHRPRCVHSLGGIEKSNGSLRPITDCSMPEKVAINNYMFETYKPFHYNSVYTAVDMLKEGEFMSLIDLKSAYRSVNVFGPHCTFQGFSWNSGDGKKWYENNRLSFGLRCAPYIFSKLSDFIVLISKFYGVPRVVNYLDDFLVIASTEEECLRGRNTVIEIMEFLGFDVAYNKVTIPSQVTTFLGITINSINMSLTLPEEKILKLHVSLDECLNLTYVTKKVLQKIGGLMSFCSQVVRGGRTFSRRLFDLCARAKDKGHIFLCEETLKDLQWWRNFCAVFNCKSLIQRGFSEFPIVSDSSLKGFGAWAGTDFLYGIWEKDFFPKSICSHRIMPPLYDKLYVHKDNINVYELWPVVQGIKRWGFSYSNGKIHIITDNMQVLAMINTGRSKNHLCMEWLRELFWYCFIYNVELYATYIKSEDNILADQLSRLPYKGYMDKCNISLLENNMCCVSLQEGC